MSHAGSAVRSSHSPRSVAEAPAATTSDTLNLAAEAQIFSQGATAIRAYRVMSGKVRLVRETGLKRLVVGEVGPGAYVGFNEALLKDRYWTGAVAAEPTTVEVVSARLIGRQVADLPDGLQAQLQSAAERERKLLEIAESPAVEQTFMGICRGLELLMPVGSPPQPESQLLRRLRELFGMPTPLMRQVLRVLADLNLIACQQNGPMEAMYSIADPKLMDRARTLVDRWLSSLPSILTKDAPPEPYTIDELSEHLGCAPKDITRRMMGSDFPMNIVRFDAQGVANVRSMYGDDFFKKKVTSRDLVADAQTIDELTALDVAVLREFIPQMDLSRLCQLLTRAEDEVVQHLLNALTPRMRRVAQAEIATMSKISDAVFADIEAEVMTMARAALGGRS